MSRLSLNHLLLHVAAQIAEATVIKTLVPKTQAFSTSTNSQANRPHRNKL